MKNNFDIKRVNKFFVKLAIADVALLILGLLELGTIFSSHNSGAIGLALQSMLILAIAIPAISFVGVAWLVSRKVVKRLSNLQQMVDVEPAITEAGITVGVMEPNIASRYTLEAYRQKVSQFNRRLLICEIAVIASSTAVALLEITKPIVEHSATSGSVLAAVAIFSVGGSIGLQVSLAYWLNKLSKETVSLPLARLARYLPIVLMVISMIVIGAVYIKTDTGIAGQNNSLKRKIDSAGIQYYLPSSSSSWMLDRINRSFYLDKIGDYVVAKYHLMPKDPLLYYAFNGSQLYMYKDDKAKLTKSTSLCGADSVPCAYLLTTPKGAVVLGAKNDSAKNINANTYYFQKGSTLFEFGTSFSYGPISDKIVQLPTQNLASFVDSLQVASNKQIARAFAYSSKPIKTESDDSRSANAMKSRAAREVELGQLKALPFTIYLPPPNSSIHYFSSGLPIPEMYAGYYTVSMSVSFPSLAKPYSLTETKVHPTASINPQTTQCLIPGEKTNLNEFGAKELLESCRYSFTTPNGIKVYKEGYYNQICDGYDPRNGNCNIKNTTLYNNDYVFQIGDTYIFTQDPDLVWTNTTLSSFIDSLVPTGVSDLASMTKQNSNN